MKNTTVIDLIKKSLEEHPGKTVDEIPMTAKLYVALEGLVDSGVLEQKRYSNSEYFKEFVSFLPLSYSYYNSTLGSFLLSYDEIIRESVISALMIDDSYTERQFQEMYAAYPTHDSLLKKVSDLPFSEYFIQTVLYSSDYGTRIPSKEIGIALVVDLISSLSYLSEDFIDKHKLFLNYQLLKKDNSL